MKPNHQSETLLRAALPEVMFAADAAIALRLPEPIAESALIAGALGPAFEVDGRPAVLRDAFLAALARRASVSSGSRREVLCD